MVEVKNLTKKYGSAPAVEGLNFKIESGTICGLLGPNGVGKSTTMNIMTGCLAATEGTVTVSGYDIFADSIEAKRRIGYLPEIPPVYPDMTPTEYLSFVARAKGVKKGELKQQVSDALEITSLGMYANRLIANLSKGYRQRVGIAQAVIGNPEVVILDEPMVGLDPQQIADMRALICALGKNHTVLLSSHMLSEVQTVCQMLIIMTKGRIVASDTLANFETDSSCGAGVELLVRGDREVLTTHLEGLDFIGEYSVGMSDAAGTCGATVIGKGGEDIRERLFFSFSDAKIPILNMEAHKQSLEQIFLQLTAENEVQAQSERGR